MATKRGKNKPNILVSRGGIHGKSPRTLVLLGGPRKRVGAQIDHLLPLCNTLKYQESGTNCDLGSNCCWLQPLNKV